MRRGDERAERESGANGVVGLANVEGQADVAAICTEAFLSDVSGLSMLGLRVSRLLDAADVLWSVSHPEKPSSLSPGSSTGTGLTRLRELMSSSVAERNLAMQLLCSPASTAREVSHVGSQPFGSSRCAIQSIKFFS
mmetsp:Transcript_50138/g.133181  ORF Transcript_50138/g.133181 Transcript_50138/m.133181 type:complete len:137 (+) Transcript_50138:167-577(+)